MSLEEILAKIRETRDEIKVAWQNPAKLGDIQLLLSTWNGMLSDHYAIAHNEATKAKRDEYYRLREKEGKSHSEAKDRAALHELDIRHEYEMIKFAYDSTADLITSIQVQIKTITKTRDQEGL